jgi:hypothetical protein
LSAIKIIINYLSKNTNIDLKFINKISGKFREYKVKREKEEDNIEAVDNGRFYLRKTRIFI